MNARLKVKDNLTLERDLSTNAIINTDVSSYESMLVRRKAFFEKDAQIASLQNDVDDLKAMHTQMAEQIQKLITINTVNNSII
jgi:hypothetical protein